MLPEIDDPIGRSQIYLAVATRQASDGDVLAARRSVDQGILLVPNEALELRLELLNTSALLLMEEGRPHAALEPLLLVPRLSTDAFPRASARAEINLAFCLYDLGDLDGAAAWGELAWDKRSDGHHDPSHTLWLLTDVAWKQGDSEAMERCERRLRATRPDGEGRAHQRRCAAKAYALSKVHLWRGEWNAARQQAEIARKAFASTAVNIDFALCDAVDIRSLHGAGDLDAAWALVNASLNSPGLTGLIIEDLTELQGRIALDRNDPHAAVEAFRRLADLRGTLRNASGRSMRQLTERHLAALRQVRDIELSTLNATLQRTLVQLEESRRDLQRRVDARTLDLQNSVAALSAEVDSRRLAEEAARTANQTKTLFLARMSHELRTPLTAITGYAEILEEDAPGDLQPDIQRILQSTSSLLQMIDELLDLVRIEAGELRLLHESVDLKEVLNQAIDVGRILVERQGLPFIVDRADCPPVRGDPQRIRQVVLNLLSNAAKFTSSGSVTLRSEVFPDHVEVSVCDTGIGIAPANHERVFKPFEQVDPSYTRSNEGTGLGLSISTHLMDAMDGRLTLDSREGEGATFTMHLQRIPRAAGQSS